jgi:NlpC/P60 family putative phage cell wall peptidase
MRVVTIARSWLGKPCHNQASLRGVGCDCLGLARGVWREVVGAEPFPIPPNSRDWGETAPPEVLAIGARRMMIKVKPAAAGPGALIHFRKTPRAIAKHVAIQASRWPYPLTRGNFSVYDLRGRWMKHWIWAAALAGMLAFTPHPTLAERLALIIGNDTYDSLPILRKARNDAVAVSQALDDLGFSVTLVTDANRRSMTRELSDLAAAITPGDEVVFYFAGHGVEIAGRNHLLPADAPAARPGDEAFLQAESVAVDDILYTLQGRGARVTVLILDACRDNPFPRDGTRSAGGARGLAPVSAPEGAFILFSAGTGQSALDALGPSDQNPNSVFTRALLPLLSAPGLPMQDIARALKGEVETAAAGVNHKQRPAYYDELTGDFVLNSGDTATTRGAEPLHVAAPSIVRTAPPNPCDSAARDWQAIAALSDKMLLRSFASTHADCEVFSRAATDRADQLEATVAPQTKTTAPAAILATLRVKMGVSEGYMNARSGPGTMHAILFRIAQGKGGLKLSECRKADAGGGKGDWCLVMVDGNQGWVSKTGLEPE